MQFVDSANSFWTTFPHGSYDYVQVRLLRRERLPPDLARALVKRGQRRERM